MYLLSKFGGHSIEYEMLTLDFFYVNALKKSEFITSIHHIGQIFRIRRVISTVFEERYMKCLTHFKVSLYLPLVIDAINQKIFLHGNSFVYDLAKT